METQKSWNLKLMRIIRCCKNMNHSQITLFSHESPPIKSLKGLETLFLLNKILKTSQNYT